MGKYNIERISQQIRIGWDGENNWRPQTFDCSPLLKTRPNGTVTLWILPNGESEAFPVALTADGNLRTWTPLDSELVGGSGKLQFHCQSGTDVGKSPVYRYVVEGSLLTGAGHPDETPSWAVQVVADVQDAIDGISETVEELLPDAVEDYMTEHPIVETDPTVPAWAKAAQKPSYTAAEVGALPDSYTAPVTSVNGKTGAVNLGASDVNALPAGTSIPSKTSDLTNDSGFITASQVPSAPVQNVNGKTGAVVLDASDVGALPDDTVIPAAVTEQTVSGWGFTKNTGTYSKPSGGIPDSDIASAATWNAKGTYSKPSGGIPASDLASAVQTSLGKADTALQTHQSLAAYRTASAQDTIDAAQDQAISGKLSTTGNAYRSASIPMGELDSTSTATVMTATVDGITELRDGVCMWLRNGVITSASGFTLNVNSLGAKPCYSSLAAESRSTTIFNVNYTMLFVYNSTRVDGGCWDIVYGVDTNTTYTPVKLGFGYGTCTTAAATAAKTASISSYALTTGGIVSIKFSYDVPANATLNITSKGAKAIYHRGAAITAGVIKAGDTATFVYSTYYHLVSIDRDEAGDTLPAVTASDNGKFLRVVSGAWAAATIPAAEINSF